MPDEGNEGDIVNDPKDPETDPESGTEGNNRGKNGQFKKKTKAKVKPAEPEPEGNDTDGGKTDPIDIAMELIELKTKLGDEVYNTFKDYPAEDRLKLLKAVDKAAPAAGRGKVIKGGNPPAPKEDKRQTILETNNSRLFFKDLKKGNSYGNISQRIRGKQK